MVNDLKTGGGESIFNPEHPLSCIMIQAVKALGWKISFASSHEALDLFIDLQGRADAVLCQEVLALLVLSLINTDDNLVDKTDNPHQSAPQ